jgi:hypothetical protein
MWTSFSKRGKISPTSATTVSHRPQFIVEPSFPAAPRQTKVTAGSASSCSSSWCPQLNRGRFETTTPTSFPNSGCAMSMMMASPSVFPRPHRPLHRLPGELPRLRVPSNPSPASWVRIPAGDHLFPSQHLNAGLPPVAPRRQDRHHRTPLPLPRRTRPRALAGAPCIADAHPRHAAVTTASLATSGTSPCRTRSVRCSQGWPRQPPRVRGPLSSAAAASNQPGEKSSSDPDLVFLQRGPWPFWFLNPQPLPMFF